MANKQVYTLDINTSGLISGYKNAIRQMEQAGTSADITKGLTASLKNLEEQYQKLEAEGKVGFTNSKEIDNFKKRIDKLMKSFSSFELSLESVSGNTTKLATKAKDAGLKIKNAFEKLNVKDSVQAMNQVLAAEDKIKAVSQVIERELDTRAKKVDELKQKYQQASEAAAQQISATKVGGADALGKQYINAGGTKSNIFKGASSSTVSEILNTASTIIKSTNDIQTAWSQMESYLAQHDYTRFFTAAGKYGTTGLDGLRQNMEQVFTSTTNVAQQEATKLQAIEQQVAEAMRNANLIGRQGTDGTWTVQRNRIQEITAATRERINAETRLHNVLNVQANDETQVRNALEGVANATQSVSGSARSTEAGLDQMADNLRDTASNAENVSRTFDNMRQRMLNLLSATSVLNLIKRAIKQTYEDVKQLDKSFASIAMVTNYTVKEMWNSYSLYADMASQLGQRTNSIIQASALFYQQGLDTNEALELTTNTMKLATLAGNDFQKATEEMTSAIRGFKMEMEEGSHVTDVYSTLAAHAAATVDDIAQAMARTASIANSAGMSFENTSAFLTQVIETTQESAENIGTSLKTIIARFTELKDNVAGTTDSEFEDLEFNKVDKALKSVGISLKDTTGQFRNLDQVFLELSEKWQDLDRNTQRYVATIAAGSRQQSRFIAMMDNYDRTVELMEMAADAEGKADEQFAKYADTMEYKLNQLTTKWEEFRVQTLNSDFFKSVTDGLSNFLDRLKNVDIKRAIAVTPAAIWAAKTFITNFIKTLRTSVSAVGDIGTLIGKQITKKLSAKISVRLDEEALRVDIERAQAELDRLRAKHSSINIDILGGIKRNDFETDKEYLDAYINSVIRASNETLSYNDVVSRLANEFRVTNEAIVAGERDTTALVTIMETERNQFTALNQEIERLRRSEQRVQAIQGAFKTAFTQISSSITMATSALISGGASWSDALKMFTTQLGLSAVQMAIQWAALAITNRTGGFQAGRAAGEGFSAGLASTGWGALIVGIGAAIGGVALVIDKLYNNWRSKKKTLQDELVDIQSQIKESEKAAGTAKEQKKKADETLKSARDLREEYDKLSKKIVKNEEEQTRYNELVEQIRTDMPEIVLSYNTITGELVTQNKLWDDIIKKSDQASKIANRGSYAAQLKVIGDQRREAEKAFQVNTKNTQKYLESYQNIINAFSKDGSLSGYSNFGEWLRANYGIDAKTSDIDSVIRTLQAGLTQGGYANAPAINQDVKEIGNFLNYLKTQGSADMNKILLGMEQLGQGFGEQANENADYLKQYIDSNKSFIKEQERIKDEQISELDKLETAQLAQFVKGELGVSDAVANFIAAGFEEASTGLFNAAFGKENIETLERGLSGKTGGADNLKSWEELEKVVDEYGITVTDVFNEINSMIEQGIIQGEKLEKGSWDKKRTDDKDWKDYSDELGYFDAAYSALANERQLFLSKLTDDEQAAIERFYSDVTNLSKADIETARKDLISALSSDEAKQTAEAEATKFVKELDDKIKESAKDIGVTEDVFQKWSTQELNALDTAFSTLSSDSEKYAQKFIQDVLNSGANLTRDEILGILQIDYTDIDLTNVKVYSERIKDLLSQSFDENTAAQLADKFITAATEAGVASFGVRSKDTVDSILDTIGTELEKQVKGYSSISKIIESQLKDGFISFSQSKELEKALSEIGLTAADYLTYGENGGIVLNEQALTTAFKEQIDSSDYILEVAQKQTLAKIEQLEQEQTSIELKGREKVESLELLQAEKKRTLELLKQNQLRMQAAGNYGQEYARTLHDISVYEADVVDINTQISIVNSETEKSIKKITDQLIEYKKGFNNIKPGSEEYINIQNQILAAMREIDALNNSYLPDSQKIKSVTEAEEDRVKALQKLRDAQQDVIDKQEKLNEKLKDYNDLLYGSDNRKSSLDYLYNYEEAINSFNDEINRSKDLLTNAKTVEDSTDAIKRYAAATHNLIAEETAKQRVLQAGLSNYADMLENGRYSYTDSESGKTTTVDFGGYVRKDDRTGKYVLDQRLLNEAKFTDKMKSYIEEQVSNYNKYSEELLKSEDNVRKAEKELQEERQNALKDYTKFEQEIADALKQQYQDEIDELKNKYDSMKDADNEYVKALQKAVDKQRKLRESESKYEDLAKKEKQLSLMQRDTSGSNELETRKLEEEIQKDRESMLDDAVDRIIDELSEIYESQQELHDSEIELKEALIDNTLYWNMQAESLAQSFSNAEDYAQFLSSLSEEYSMMTLAQQQQKLLEYGDSYTAATEYMAMQAMNTASETGDFVIDTMMITGEEVVTIVAQTAETFTEEVVRAYNETTAAFEEDMRKAQSSIVDARNELQSAIEKLNECAVAANQAASALAQAQAMENNSYDVGGTGVTVPERPKTTTAYDFLVSERGVIHNALDEMTRGVSDEDKVKLLTDQIWKSYGLEKGKAPTSEMISDIKDYGLFLGRVGEDYRVFDTSEDRDKWIDPQAASMHGNVKKYEGGGLVNYTGPAWVDGTPTKPEAFLNAEDTMRIGNAAKILSDLPILNDYEQAQNTVNNTVGDINLEVNINIEHIDSEVDVDNMIAKVKDDIVSVARPIGTNIILSQRN